MPSVLSKLQRFVVAPVVLLPQISPKSHLFPILAEKHRETKDAEEDGTRHFMVNVIEPQFNLHSEDANVSSLDYWQ